MYVYMYSIYVCMYIHTCVCVYVYTYVHMYVCTYVCMYVYVLSHAFIHMCVCTVYGTSHKKLDDERRSNCVRTVTDRALTAVRTAYVRVLFVPTRVFFSI